MKYEDIRVEACAANKKLATSGLVAMTFGNVGVFDKNAGVFAIKPSGVDYADLTPECIPVVDLDCNVVDGSLRPSSDTPTYAVLFKAFGVRAITHTHSKTAVAFAQAGRGIPALGTTHADHFYGDVPVTRKLTEFEIAGEYEKETGNVIVEKFRELNLKPEEMSAVLVHSHGPFTWGASGAKALEYAVALELCAEMAFHTLLLNPQIPHMQSELLDKHFLRKHGGNAYYGQTPNQ